MQPHIETTVAALKERFEAQDAEGVGEAWLVVPADQITAAAQALRDEFDFNFLSSLTASDYWPQDCPRFHLVYQFYAHTHQVRLGIRVALDGDEPELPSLDSLYPNATWYERELWDMFGIKFTGNKDLRRILMPYDWVGHPLRKDYPLSYEEPQFSFNFEDIQIRKHRGRYEEA
jgi:NADH-quinone oxidoreductase subunit C